MDMRDLIEAGNKKAGEQKALAIHLGINPIDLAQAKAGRRKLPAPACFILAEYLGIDPARVIAASELVTEKNEERRKVFYPFVMGRAAMIAAFVITALPPESQAASHSMRFDYGANWHYVKFTMRRRLTNLLNWFMIAAFAHAT